MLQSWWQKLRGLLQPASGTGSPTPGDTPANYTQDREDDRRAHMSAEDQEWEAASLRKSGEGPSTGARTPSSTEDSGH
jgi:hypothetical protein